MPEFVEHLGSNGQMGASTRANGAPGLENLPLWAKTNIGRYRNLQQHFREMSSGSIWSDVFFLGDGAEKFLPRHQCNQSFCSKHCTSSLPATAHRHNARHTQFSPSLHTYKLAHSLAAENEGKTWHRRRALYATQEITCVLLRLQVISHVYLDVLLAARGVKSSAEVSADG